MSSRLDDAISLSLAEAKQSGIWLRSWCPICAEERGDRGRANFGLNTETGWWHCFRCGKAGKRKGWQCAEVQEVAPVEPAGIPQGFLPLVGEALTSKSLAPAVAYLRKRKVLELAETVGIGACLHGRYAGRVVVPIHTASQQWAGWVSRAWGKSDCPYLYPKMPRAQLLFNAAALEVATSRPVCVVEGVFDALALWPDAVAVLGKPSAWQIRQLAHAKRPVCAVMDGDAWEEGAALALELMILGQTAGSIRLPAKKDPDEVNREWLEVQISEAINQCRIL